LRSSLLTACMGCEGRRGKIRRGAARLWAVCWLFAGRLVACRRPLGAYGLLLCAYLWWALVVVG
jgi:hypothetical protein